MAKGRRRTEKVIEPMPVKPIKPKTTPVPEPKTWKERLADGQAGRKKKLERVRKHK